MPTKMRTCATCSNLVRTKYARCEACREKDVVIPKAIEIVDVVAKDREKLKTAQEMASLKDRYKHSLETIDELETLLDHKRVMQQHADPVCIEPHHGSGTSEATPVIVLSDFHIEEEVGDEVGDLNRFDLDIAETRVTEAFQGGARLVQLLNQDVKIHTVVVGLLGDYITNQIHGAENAENNQLTPMNAIIFAQNLIVGGIEFWLNHTPYNYVFVCKSGNHARVTLKTRFSSETGHSLEYLMFLALKDHFRNEPRCTFIIENGLHSYVDIYDWTLRFHHGHSIKYGGGVGGITIPTNKAIAQWDKAKHASLDVFGHFHQQTIHRKFICNGSLIGYNGFAAAIKAEYEPPMQTLFLMDKKRGRTAVWPILFSR